MYDLWLRLLSTIAPNMPTLINVLLVFGLGLLCWWWVARFSWSILRKIRFTQALERIGWEQLLYRFDIHFNTTNTLATVIGLVFFLLFGMVGFEVLGLTLFAGLLEKVILYYPNIMISILIFVVSVFAIDISQKIFIGTKTLGTITYSRFLNRTAEWTIRILAFLAIFYQLGIIPQLIVMLFGGIILTASLALGLALGLAGREPMAKMLKEIGKILRGS